MENSYGPNADGAVEEHSMVAYLKNAIAEIDENLRAEALNPNALWERGVWITKLLNTRKFYVKELVAREQAEVGKKKVFIANDCSVPERPLIDYINEVTQARDAMEKR